MRDGLHRCLRLAAVSLAAIAQAAALLDLTGSDVGSFLCLRIDQVNAQARNDQSCRSCVGPQAKPAISRRAAFLVLKATAR